MLRQIKRMITGSTKPGAKEIDEPDNITKDKKD